MEFHYVSFSPEDTRKLGRKLGRVLAGGDVVCLAGGLGSGKTALAQGIGEGLNVRVPLTSPTFTLIQEYRGHVQGDAVENNQGNNQRNGQGIGRGKDQGYDVRVVHMDLYRLAHPEEAEVIGVGDSFQEDAVVLIEWPEIVRDILPDERLDILIEGNGEMPRKFILRADSDDWAQRWPRLSGGFHEISDD